MGRTYQCQRCDKYYCEDCDIQVIIEDEFVPVIEPHPVSGIEIEWGPWGEVCPHCYKELSKICPHCGGDKEIRNPTGKCDHLHYPDGCEVCTKMSEEHLEVA